ncbi:hypothetical protein ACOMHN_034280 [Nucella lapillus]
MAKLPRGHRTFAPSCVGPQSTQVAPAARSARDLGPSASTNYPLATPVATKASHGSQGPLRPIVPIDNRPKGDDQVFLPSSNSWGRWSSVDRELDTTVWHSSARRWVLVPPTSPAFADSPPPTFSHPPRGATDSESDEGPEEDHFRSFMEHGPSRARPRTQSLHGQDSGSCRAPSPPDFFEDEAPPGSSVTAGALLEPVLPHFLTTAQPTERADNEVLCLFGQPYRPHLGRATSHPYQCHAEAPSPFTTLPRTATKSRLPFLWEKSSPSNLYGPGPVTILRSPLLSLDRGPHSGGQAPPPPRHGTGQIGNVL